MPSTSTDQVTTDVDEPTSPVNNPPESVKLIDQELKFPAQDRLQREDRPVDKADQLSHQLGRKRYP